jgi:hypothetical protein
MENDASFRVFAKMLFHKDDALLDFFFSVSQRIHFELALNTMTTNEKKEEPTEASEIVEESNRNLDSEEFQEFMTKVTQKCQVNLFENHLFAVRSFHLTIFMLEI